MELLTKKLFEQWMETILERLERQDEMLLALKAPEKREHKISKRSLQRYRSTGALPYKILGKKTYYSEDDVLKFLSEHVKDFQKDDVEFYKARIHNFFNK